MLRRDKLNIDVWTDADRQRVEPREQPISCSGAVWPVIA